MLSLGGGGGGVGSDRAWEFSHGRHGAFMNKGIRHPLPAPGILPPSNSHHSKVGDGLIIQGDLGGRAAAAGLGGVGAAGSGGEGGKSTMSFAEILELMSKSAGGGRISQCSSRTSVIPEQNVHPPISYPTQQLRISYVCCFHY